VVIGEATRNNSYFHSRACVTWCKTESSMTHKYAPFVHVLRLTLCDGKEDKNAMREFYKTVGATRDQGSAAL
jgi:hypothetical protein